MNKSESIAQLAEALSKAQGEMAGAKKDNANPFFKSKYADLASVWEACREPLRNYGLAVTQILETRDNQSQVICTTILMHSSGEWISGELAMTPVKNDPQGVGSCGTYARRYGLSAIVGIAPEDDDGNQASGKNAPTRTEQPIPIQRPSNRGIEPPAPNSIKAAPKVAEPERETTPPVQDPIPALAEAIVKKTFLEGVALAHDPDATIDLARQRNLHREFKAAIPETAAESTKKAADVIFREWLKNRGFVGPDQQGTTKTIPVLLFDETKADAVKFAGSLR